MHIMHVVWVTRQSTMMLQAATIETFQTTQSYIEQWVNVAGIQIWTTMYLKTFSYKIL